MREIYRILHRHGVNGLSPAAVSHSIITLVRKFCNNAELITPEVMTANVPHGFGKVATPLIERTERALRRWLQNVQGVWQDGMVGKRGSLWIPSDGMSCCLQIRGRNLDIGGQRIELRSEGKKVSTGSLAGGESFTLNLQVPAGSVPIRSELSCYRTIEVGPLDPRYGPRQAGCMLDDFRIITP